MANGPLERKYGRYRIIFRKDDHVQGRPMPHVEVHKEREKIGNYDMATGRPLPGQGKALAKEVMEAIGDYIRDPQVQKKVKEAIRESFFDLSKPAGEYGGIPRGFYVTVQVEFTPESLRERKRK